jgi:D-proline reductase (dithiol) PrdB
VSLIARYLEENGIPTVMIASAKDIVEHCGVARLLFVDYPLGNPCGEPYDVAQQRQVFNMALDLLETATAPRTTWDAGLVWSGGDAWKDLVFTEEQPFTTGEALVAWNARKEKYRQLKAEGKV